MENGMDPVHIKHDAEATQVALEAALSIADARVLHEKLSAVLVTAKTVMMDGSRVERLDAATMQVLAGFCRAAHERGLIFAWKNISPALQQAARLLGLESLLHVT